ncbi:hypothetical protein D5086_001803, partial [Populus alba]
IQFSFMNSPCDTSTDVASSPRAKDLATTKVATRPLSFNCTSPTPTLIDRSPASTPNITNHNLGTATDNRRVLPPHSRIS